MVAVRPWFLKFLIVFPEPVDEHLAVFLVGIDKTRVARLAEQMPATARDMLIERGGDNRRTDVARAAADERRLRDEVQAIRIFKVLQTAQRLIFVGPQP